jgi:hypothetical protein
MPDPDEMIIEPELPLRDGRTIRSVADALGLLREHESRPGVDNRDEVLHLFERAQSDTELQHAAEAFLAWVKELDLLAPPSGAGAPPKSLHEKSSPPPTERLKPGRA